MKKNPLSGLLSQTAIVAIAGFTAIHSAQSATLYWDGNGATPGAGVTPTGTWGVDPFWSTSSAGTDATANTPTTAADDLFFSAGSDTVGDYTVTLDGTQDAKTITAQTGNLILAGGTLALARNTTNGSAYLVTGGTANLTLNSALLVDNSVSGNSFLNFTPVAGTTITINGAVNANTFNPSNTNRVFIRHAGAGEVVINSNLGADANMASALNTTSSLDGVSGGGVLTLNGSQTLAAAGLGITVAGKTGTVNLGGTVNLANTVTLGAISISHATADMAGATVNINSDVQLGDRTVTVRNGGVVNVAGKLTTTGNILLGTGAAGNTFHGGAVNILNGGEADVFNVQVADNLVLTNGGTLSGNRLRLGEGTTGGKFVLGNATGVGTATFTLLDTEGSSTDNAIVGGNSAISTFTLNNSLTQSFSGKLGGEGASENNLALVKNGAASLTLSGVNTYTGNTTINAGSLILAETGGLNFAIGADGVNNGIQGTGTLQLDGKFTFDLSGAAAVGSWNIVDVSTLTATFSGTFTVEGFADVGGNLWERTVGGSTYTFDETSGLLNAIPEPGVAALLFGAGVFLLIQRRRFRAS